MCARVERIEDRAPNAAFYTMFCSICQAGVECFDEARCWKAKRNAFTARGPAARLLRAPPPHHRKLTRNLRGAYAALTRRLGGLLPGALFTQWSSKSKHAHMECIEDRAPNADVHTMFY